MKKASSGFTLIELIVVIVILGILAGVALPRFINQTTNARKAAVNGLAGNLAGAIALAQQEYMAEGSNTSVVITMNGTTVSVYATTGAPSASILGSATNSPMQNMSGFSVGAASSGTVSINFSPTAITGCSVTYIDGASTAQPSVTAVTASC